MEGVRRGMRGERRKSREREVRKSIEVDTLRGGGIVGLRETEEGMGRERKGTTRRETKTHPSSTSSLRYPPRTLQSHIAVAVRSGSWSEGQYLASASCFFVEKSELTRTSTSDRPTSRLPALSGASISPSQRCEYSEGFFLVASRISSGVVGAGRALVRTSLQ